MNNTTIFTILPCLDSDISTVELENTLICFIIACFIVLLLTLYCGCEIGRACIDKFRNRQASQSQPNIV